MNKSWSSQLLVGSTLKVVEAKRRSSPRQTAYLRARANSLSQRTATTRLGSCRRKRSRSGCKAVVVAAHTRHRAQTDRYFFVLCARWIRGGSAIRRLEIPCQSSDPFSCSDSNVFRLTTVTVGFFLITM